MKTTVKFLGLILAVFLLGSCNGDDNNNTGGTTDDDPMIPIPTSTAAEKLLNNLKANAAQGNILLGHQATTIAGVGWRWWERETQANNFEEVSDFKDITGKFPVIHSWELAQRPGNQNETNDWISFDQTMEKAVKAYNRGGVNMFNMHPYRYDNNGDSWSNAPGYVTKILPGGEYHNQYKATLDRYVLELKKIKDDNGNLVPFIFRPYHEGNHFWFWWGSDSCTDEEYKQLYRFTVEYMKNKGLDNMLVCYAPGYFQDIETYEARYPGDDIVDILGFDGYYGNNEIGVSWDVLENHLIMLKTIGNSKNKPITWCETGEPRLTTNDYFTQLNQMITAVDAKIIWVMFWANYEEGEYYIPYPDMNNNAIQQDFLNFTGLPKYQMEGEHPDLYE